MTSGPDVGHVAAISDVPDDAAVVLPYFQDDQLADTLGAADLAGPPLQAAIERGEAAGKPYSTTLFHSASGPSVLLIGAGSRGDFDELQARRLAAAAAIQLVPRRYRRLAFVDRGGTSSTEYARCVVEGAIYGAYNPALKKTRDTPAAPLAEILVLASGDGAQISAGGQRGKTIGEAISLARDMVNLPPNQLTPRAFAERAEEAAAPAGATCEILDERAIAELGMGCLLGVAAGSREPPRLIVLRYGNPDADIRLALVGKGITFDSGGLSLKSGEGMMHMKGDMGGAAAVIAAITAIANLQIPGLSVTAYAGCTENMPSGSAMRPGDVFTAFNGETVEVLNTDAEGRLVLADVLAYACSQGATHIVDAATLTGGAVTALGHEATLAAGKPLDWVYEVVAAAADGLERAWPMPIYDEYRKRMDSEIADIKNVGGRAASPLTASAFLRDFVKDVQWCHLDIAGTAWAEDAKPYQQKGGTGAGVGTLVAVAERLSAL